MRGPCAVKESLVQPLCSAAHFFLVLLCYVWLGTVECRVKELTFELGSRRLGGDVHVFQSRSLKLKRESFQLYLYKAVPARRRPRQT